MESHDDSSTTSTKTTNKVNDELTAQLLSSDDAVVFRALNSLLEASHDVDANYSLGRGGDGVVRGLVSVFDRCLGWRLSGDDGDDDDENRRRRKRRRKTDDDAESACAYRRAVERVWEDNCESDHADEAIKEWHRFCREKFQRRRRRKDGDLNKSKTRVLEAVVMVIRNLSFVAANARFLVYSSDVMRALTGCLYCHSDNSDRGKCRSSDDDIFGNATSCDVAVANGKNNVCLHAVHTLINLAPLIDITGCSLFADLLLLEDDRYYSHSINSSSDQPLSHSLGFGGMYLAKRFDVRGTVSDAHNSKIPMSTVRECSWFHIRTILAIFEPLSRCVTHCDHRAIVLSSLELLLELLPLDRDHHRPGDEDSNNKNDNSDSDDISFPEALRLRCIDLLHVPRLGPDSLDYVDPVGHVVNRVTALKLANGHDNAVDHDLRDRAADLLERCTTSCPEWRRRCADVRASPRLVDYLVQMTRTRVGRSDAPQIAGSVLANLAAAERRSGEDDDVGTRYAEGDLLLEAARDLNIANVVCNSLLT